jgi:hypothetical protein
MDFAQTGTEQDGTLTIRNHRTRMGVRQEIRASPIPQKDYGESECGLYSNVGLG